MYTHNQRAKVNVKVLVLLVTVLAAISTSLIAARQIRRSVLSERALEEGLAAYEKGQWEAAVANFSDYLARNPGDLDVLRKSAEASLSVRPLDVSSVMGAVWAYRRILELDPGDEKSYEQLLMLHRSLGDWEEYARLARTRLARDPNDHQATLRVADAMVNMNRGGEARQILRTLVKNLEALAGKHPEYVRACIVMSTLAEESAPSGVSTDDPAAAEQETPLAWLNRAVAYAPDCADALFHRARFYRLAADADGSEQDRIARIARARADLEAASDLATEDPRIRYSLATEWLFHNELDRAAAELEAVDRLPRDVLAKHFLDIKDSKTTSFLLHCQLARRRGASVEAAALADEVLASLDRKETGHRLRVLPTAVGAYVAAGQIPKARQNLNEYLELVKGQRLPAGTVSEIAALSALVEVAEDRLYNAIDLLQPVAGQDSSNPQLLRLLAQAYSQTGQARRAAEALEQYRRLHPRDRQAARELARQYAVTGDFQRAFEVARQAESLDPTDIDLKLLRIGTGISRAAGQGGSPDASSLQTLAAELDELRRQHPDRVDIRILQSVAAASLGMPEKAEQELRQAIEECTETLRAEILLARHYVQAGRMDEAMAVCEAACQRHKHSAEPWLALADLYGMKEDHESARRTLEQGLETVADRAVRKSLSMKLALLELTHGDRRAGIDLLKELAEDPREIQARLLLLNSREIREAPSAAAALIDGLREAEGQNGLWWRLHQASLWLESGDWASRRREIRNLLQHCTRMDPSWPAPVLLLGGMHERQREWKQAEEIYRQGLQSNPASAEVAERLLNLLVSQNRFPEAEKVLRQIQNPQAAADWRVRIALGSGDVSRAIDELRLRISNDPQDARSRIELARLVYQETRDADQAMRYLDEAGAVAPDSQQLAAVRASILRSDGRAAEARRVLDDYVAESGTFAAHWTRAVYLAEGGDIEAAEQDYRKLTTFADNAAVGYELLGTFYASLNRFDQAVAALEEGLRAHAGDLRLMRSLMRLLFSRAQPQDRERAFGILTELEERQPEDLELMMVRALQSLNDPAPQSFAARRRLENAVKREPSAVNAHLTLIHIAMQEQDYKTACDLALQALSSSPGHPALLLARARGELAMGYAPVAARLAQQVLQQDSNNLEAAELFVQAALSRGDRNLLEQGRELVDTAVRRDPSNERLLILRSHVYVALNEPTGGIPELQAYCGTEQGSASILALVTLADLWRIAGDPAEADKVIRQAEELDRRHQVVVHSRFAWLVAQNRFDDLKGISSAYVQAREQDPSLVLRAAGTLMAAGSAELKAEGVALFRHGATHWPRLADARLGLASSLYQTGDAEAAEKMYREFLRQHPNNPRALNDLAWILQEQFQRYEEALELANRGLRQAPDNVYLLDTKGSILLNMPDRLAEAKIYFGDIVRISSRSASPDPHREAHASFQLGRICVKLDESAQARKYLSRALEIDRTAGVLTPEDRAEIDRLVAGIGSLAR